jgi:hypothetical protein
VPYTAGDTWRDSLLVEPCRRTCALPQPHLRRRAVPAVNGTPLEDGGKSGGKGDAEVCSDVLGVVSTEDDIKHAIMTTGPVVAYIDAYRYVCLWS